MSVKELIIGIAPGRTFPGSWWDMVEVCQRLRLNGVEFKHELPFILPERWSWEMVKRIAAIAKEEKWFLSLHGPYTNIGFLLPKRWRAAVDEHLEALEVAQALGAQTYTIHPGWVEEKYCTPDLLRRCRDKTSEALAEILAHSDGIKICVENQNPSEKDKAKAGVSPEHLHYLVRDLPQAMFTLDIGHAYVFNKAPENFAALLGPKRIGLMHIHDNHGAEDSHLPPGRGSIDWRNFLSYYLSQDCESPLFLETIGSEAEFREGRDFLIKIWEEALVKEGADERR